MSSDAARDEVVLIQLMRQSLDTSAKAALAALQSDCPHMEVVETTYRPIVAQEIEASYRLCLVCGVNERMVRGRYRRLTTALREVGQDSFEGHAWRLERELGIKIRRGTV